ncbi:MAG: UvrD-helicase domain-containing protein [Bacteroidota bacterium]
MQEAAYKIYDASAGSGKTFTLVSNYLKIILSSFSKNNFRHILAITFTNKAVDEMKQRILRSLFEFGQDPTPESSKAMLLSIAQESGLSSHILRERSREVLKQILHNYAFFDISTIDKFTHRLIRTFAKDLKLPQNFEVVLDMDLLLDEAIERLVQKAGTSQQLTKVLLDFALEKIDEDKSWDITVDLNRMGKLLFNETHIKQLKYLEEKNIADFLALKKNLSIELTMVKQQVAEKSKTVLQLIHAYGLQANDFPRETLPNHFKKIMDSECEPSKLYGNKLEENLKEGKILKSGIEIPSNDLAPKILTHYLDIKADIYKIAFLKNAYQNIVPLTVLNAIQQEIKVIELERDQLPISSFNSIISKEIKNQPAPFIYERLGEKYRHYFIDEFQDTSEMQWDNLVPLIGNALESEDEKGKRGSLLVVGDAKQAIYRWRGGKAEQFMELMDSKTNPFMIPPTTASLGTNYRSHEEIIKFNNDFFTLTSPFLANNAYNKLFINGNSQEYNSKEGGLVQINFIENEQNEDVLYCEEVLTIIKDTLQKKYVYRDICILTRKRKHGIILADYLMQHHIPIISSETLLLNSSRKVQFLINILAFCDLPQNKETSYNILYFLATKEEDKHTFIHNHLSQLESMLMTEYGFDIQLLKYFSVYDGLEYAIKQFELVDDSDAHLTYLMDVVMEVEQKEGGGIRAFLSYWEKKREKLSVVAPESMNAIQLMTIHKAKGLEFPIVLFPYANTYIYEEINPKVWLPVEDVVFNGFKEVLINKKKEVEHYGTIPKRVYLQEQHKLELDAFNLLYVALTRAVKALFIITKKDLSSKGMHKTDHYSGLFIHYLKEKGLWQDDKKIYLKGTLAKNPKNLDSGHLQQDVLYSYSSKNRPTFNILAKSGLLWDTDRGNAISEGNLIHYLLSHIGTKKDIENGFKLALSRGEIHNGQIPRLRQKILQIVNHPKLRPYYDDEGIIKNEWDIITKNGLILRPDRIVLKGDKATIIDYKTGKKNNRYHQQLYQYSDAIEEMGYLIENRIIIYINDNITPEFI